MKYKYLIPAFIWFFIILAVISIPASSIPKSQIFKIPHLDKLAHATIFCVFTFLLNYGFYKQINLIKPGSLIYAFSLAIGIIYGIATEIVQHYYIEGRSGEFLDFAANLAGSVLGLILFYFLLKTPLAIKLSL